MISPSQKEKKKLLLLIAEIFHEWLSWPKQINTFKKVLSECRAEEVSEFPPGQWAKLWTRDLALCVLIPNASHMRFLVSTFYNILTFSFEAYL